MKLLSENSILYVRGALKPFAKDIKEAGGVLPFLKMHIEFDEVFAPHFYPNRFLWQEASPDKSSNSGALGLKLGKVEGCHISTHPTHAFVGIGKRVCAVLDEHDHTKSCFYPLDKMLHDHDFSMFLFGCTESSPGFSTVHVNQFRLGLSQKHILRYLMRWDFIEDDKLQSVIPLEYPGCSASFGKFYPYYKSVGNLIEGNINGIPWIFIPSALKAAAIERQVLESEPRFVNCQRHFCPTCSLRLYK